MTVPRFGGPICARSERCGNEHDGHPKSSADNRVRMQTVPETAGICDETGNRRTERDASLLDSGDRRGSDVLLASSRARYDVLSGESPGDTDASADQGDGQE